MTIEVDLQPIVDYVSDMPTWAIVLAIAHVWYGVLGLILKKMKNKYQWSEEGVVVMSLFLLLSPIILPLWIVGWAFTMGFVTAPWRVNWRNV